MRWVETRAKRGRFEHPDVPLVRDADTRRPVQSHNLSVRHGPSLDALQRVLEAGAAVVLAERASAAQAVECELRHKRRARRETFMSLPVLELELVLQDLARETGVPELAEMLEAPER